MRREVKVKPIGLEDPSLHQVMIIDILIRDVETAVLSPLHLFRNESDECEMEDCRTARQRSTEPSRLAILHAHRSE
jgi:hypothetical protein